MKIPYPIHIIWLLLYFLVSCQKTTNEPPPKLSKEKMIDVLSDLHILEAQLQGLNQHEKDSVANVYYYHLYKLHNIHEADFYQSLYYYSRRPKQFEEMYEVICDSIEAGAVIYVR